MANETLEPTGNLWIKCDGCHETLYRDDLERELSVCPQCRHHHRIDARQRLALTLDPGSFVEHDAGLRATDALGFTDSKPYAERLHASTQRTGSTEAFVSGVGRIEEIRVSVGAFEFAFMGGSMGAVVGEKIARQFERAVSEEIPSVVFSCSGGARMQEGIFSLMQMAKVSVAIDRLRRARLPFFSVLLDPTTGGVAASVAMQGDIQIAEPGALIGFAGPRVIEQTIRQELPEGFQRSEFLLEHGLVDLIVDRREMRASLGRLLRLISPR